MNKASLKKLACIGMIAFAAVITGCGSEHKVAVVDYQNWKTSPPRLKQSSRKLQTRIRKSAIDWRKTLRKAFPMKKCRKKYSLPSRSA